MYGIEWSSVSRDAVGSYFCGSPAPGADHVVGVVARVQHDRLDLGGVARIRPLAVQLAGQVDPRLRLVLGRVLLRVGVEDRRAWAPPRRAAAPRTRHPDRPASTRSRRPRPRRSGSARSRRASRGRPLRRPSCRRRPGRAPSTWRSRPCGSAAWRSWCAAPARPPGRSSRCRARAAFRCRRPPTGRGGRRGRSCAHAGRWPSRGRSGSRSRSRRRAPGPRRRIRRAGRRRGSAGCCRRGASSPPPGTCRGSRAHARRRRSPMPPTPGSIAARGRSRRSSRRSRRSTRRDRAPAGGRRSRARG